MKTDIVIRYNDGSLTTSFTREVNDETPHSTVLEEIFGEWNNGSGRESERFLSSGVRSLSVGDYVNVGTNWYRCESIGWKKNTDQEVAAYFFILDGFRSRREAGRTHRDEMILRWHDRRNACDALGLYI